MQKAPISWEEGPPEVRLPFCYIQDAVITSGNKTGEESTALQKQRAKASLVSASTHQGWASQPFRFDTATLGSCLAVISTITQNVRGPRKGELAKNEARCWARLQEGQKGWRMSPGSAAREEGSRQGWDPVGSLAHRKAH